MKICELLRQSNLWRNVTQKNRLELLTTRFTIKRRYFPHRVHFCVLYISHETAILPHYSINHLAFEVKSRFFWEIENIFLNYMSFRRQGI